MKIRKKTTATLLIALFMISTLAVVYAQPSPLEGTQLIADNEVQEAGIVIDMPEGFTLGQLESISWSVWTEFGYPPHVDIILADDIDGSESLLVPVYNIDSLTAEINKPLLDPIYHWGEHSGEYDYGTWLETFEYAVGTGRTEIDLTNTILWVTRHGGGPGDATHGTLAEFRAGTYTQDVGDPTITVSAATSILRLEIEVDNYILNTEAYVKDIVVMGSGGTIVEVDVKALRTLTLTPVGSGIITAVPAPDYYVYSDGDGDMVELTPVPDVGWEFDRWIIDGEAAGSVVPLNVEMDVNHEVEAVFVELPQVVSISVTSDVTFDAIAGEAINPGDDIIVDNTGNVAALITASIPGTEDGDVFFQTYLQLDGEHKPWDFGSLAVEAELTIPTNLDLSLYEEYGSYTSTLVFWAEAPE